MKAGFEDHQTREDLLDAVVIARRHYSRMRLVQRTLQVCLDHRYLPGSMLLVPQRNLVEAAETPLSNLEPPDR